MNNSYAKYRIAYEAFSKYSGNLSKVDSHHEIASISAKNLKYLFDFKVFQVLLKKGKEISRYSFTKDDFTFDINIESLDVYDHKLFEAKIPFFEELKNLEDYNIQLKKGKIWGWNFDFNTTEAIAKLVSDEEKKFYPQDVEILKIVVDSIVTKHQKIDLEKELNEKNGNLEVAFSLIEKKNQDIQKIVLNQKEIIKHRTREIRKKNERLYEISKLNAHNIREPLSRILGLIEISEYCDLNELKQEILEKLKTSASDLDSVLKEIVEKSTAEIEQLNVNNEQ